jgi:UDP-N-acetylmuramoyl-tripeptide--D-alanyl-D-alanine ligase
MGVITGVGNQHLSSFGSVENIIKTKGELAKYISVNGGKLFINVDSKNAKILSENYKNTHNLSFLHQNNVKFENVEITSHGSKFTIKYNGQEEIVSTTLIGEHNISNLYIGVNVAISLGLTLLEIKIGIEELRCVPHRLEVISGNNGVTIIDDSYNCSVEGYNASLSILSKFSGKKFVITPGIIELGKEQYNENFKFGTKLASVCDWVIIDSMINFKAITDGLVSEKFDSSKIIIANSLTDAVEKLNKHTSKGDVVLFENDLPDNFN